MPNKTVTFGGVFHSKSATLPNPKTQKNTPDVIETKNDKSMLKKGFNCVGTLRNSFKMVSNNGSTLISIRLVRSKLRKRDDSNLSPESGTPNTNHNNNIIQPDVVVSANVNSAPVEPPPFLWLYSSKNNLATPTSTTASQYTLYNNDQDVLVHSSSCEDTRKVCNGTGGGGGHGLKKNLGGKWKKLVKKKSPQEAYTIPAELKDQLQHIYVY